MTYSLLLLAHWVGDFALQSSQMATQKSESMKWLSIHTLTYTGVLLVFCVFLLPPGQMIAYVLLNGLIHGVVDYFTSRLAARYIDKPRYFFPIIGFDQMIHMQTLYWTLEIRF